MSHKSRIILLIDMDCFYCQVEEHLNPELKGSPLAVVQYNAWKGGGIIAVNYPARDKGVTRHMRGDEAKEICPDIELVKVPAVRGKADLSKYRDAGKRVAAVLQKFTTALERASVDEAYMDLTGIVDDRIQNENVDLSINKLFNTFIVGSSTTDFIENVIESKEYNEDNFRLAVGAVVAEEIRAAVFKETGYQCSAGIAHNKILAKLVCGLNKPNKQTVLPHDAVPSFYETLPVKKIRSLGGKFGSYIMEKLHIQTMGELTKFSIKDLINIFDEKSASWLYNIARGIDTEPVNTRLVSKSIGCCKKFPGKTALSCTEDVQHWLQELTEEIAERLEKDLEENDRKARQMVVNYAQEVGKKEVHSSKSHPLNSYDQDKIMQNAFKIIEKNCQRQDGSYRITYLGISVGQFQDVKNIKEITHFFKNMEKNVTRQLTAIKNVDNKLNEKECDIESKEDKINDDSVYSCSTDEDENVTEKNLLHYEDVNPRSIENQNIDFEHLESTIGTGHIEETNTKFQKPSNPINKHNSFFSNYFVKGNEMSASINDNSNDSDAATAGYTQLSQEIYSPSAKSTIEAEPQNTCPHCKKVIPAAEYECHLDYHVALNIVKNEEDLYKNPNRSSPSKSHPPKANKRSKLSTSYKPIENYFKISPNNDVGGNVCEHCNRRISLEEWDVHLDYHMAKKLHLELNAARASIPDKKPVKMKKKRGLLNFLKPTG